jgi:hypothetical protein
MGKLGQASEGGSGTELQGRTRAKTVAHYGMEAQLIVRYRLMKDARA